MRTYLGTLSMCRVVRLQHLDRFAMAKSIRTINLLRQQEHATASADPLT